MPKVEEADILAVPGMGRICSVALDGWPDGLRQGDKLLIGGAEFDYEVEYIRFSGSIDSRPHFALMLGDEDIEADWFVGKEVDRA